MLLDVGIMAAFLAAGNWAFWHFDPQQPLWRRVGKVVITLVITALVSHYFPRTGVFVMLGASAIPLIYVHGIWLPRNGVNGWTGEPKDKYYALRGWKLPVQASAEPATAPANSGSPG